MVSATPIFYNNEFTGSFAMITDISERRNAEEALRESEKLYRTIVETAPGMLIICDSLGKNVYASANCVNMTGYSPEELIGKSICWVHQDDRPRMKVILEEALKTRPVDTMLNSKG